MMRRDEDLLSLFDSRRRAETRARAERANSRSKGTGSRRAPRTKGEGAGLVLTQRQVLLGSCVGTLLLVLAFFTGLAAGRPSSGVAGTSLQREAARGPRKAIRIRFESMDMATGRPVSRADLQRRMLTDWRIPQESVLAVTASAGRWIVDIGPFSSEQAADAWIRQEGLAGVTVGGSAPFHQREIRDFPDLRR